MESEALTMPAEHPEWRLLLVAYGLAEDRVAAERAAARPSVAVEQRSETPAERSDAGDAAERKPVGVRRISEVDGIADDRLAPLHGRLIAEGWLQFDLGSRDEGMLYRLTREARQALAATESAAADGPRQHAA